MHFAEIVSKSRTLFLVAPFYSEFPMVHSELVMPFCNFCTVLNYKRQTIAASVRHAACRNKQQAGKTKSHNRLCNAMKHTSSSVRMYKPGSGKRVTQL
jgi:hypothetical protein